MIILSLAFAFFSFPFSQEPAAEKSRVLRLYSLEGLVGVEEKSALGPVTHSKREGLSAREEDGYYQRFLEVMLSEGHSSFANREQLLANVQTFMEPPFLGSGALVSVQEMDGREYLIADVSTKQNAWLTHFLALQGQESNWAGAIQVSILRGDANGFESLDAANRVQVIAGPDEYSEKEAQLIVHGFTIVNAPSLVVLPKKNASIEVSDDFEYVKSWKVRTVEPGSKSVVDPQVETIHEGTSLNLRVLQLDDQNYGISLWMEYREVLKPIATDQETLVLLNEFLQYEVAYPVLDTTEIEVDFRLTDGSGIQLFAPSANLGRDIIILVRFDKVDKP